MGTSAGRQVIVSACLVLSLLGAWVGAPHEVEAADLDEALPQQKVVQPLAVSGDFVQSPVMATADGEAQTPKQCINPLMALHITATLASLAPVPSFATVADALAYAFNLALKQCPPHLEAPPPIVISSPNKTCIHRMELPTPNKFSDLVAMDREILKEILDYPGINLTQSERAELEAEINSQYGRFGHTAYGNYSNIYGIALPMRLSAWSTPYWGDFGAPKVWHYNSDALVEMTFPGYRVSDQHIDVPVGNHTVVWQADTMVTVFDKIPFFVGTAAMRYYKAAKAKAEKRLAIDASNEAFQLQIQQMLKQGNTFFVKQMAREIAENALKKGALATKKIIVRSSRYETAGDTTGASTVVFQTLRVVDSEAPNISGASPVTVEALDPGGLQSLRKIHELMAAIQVSDNCDPSPTLSYSTPPFWPLQVDNQGKPLPSSEVVWRSSDNGAASASGGVNTTVKRQQITVVDTLPPILLAPPPVMMYAQSGQKVEVPLGSPQVFDVADLQPTITYNAPGTNMGIQWPKFGRGVHYVTWRATDRSQNRSQASKQLVNIKAPGTNTKPTAAALTGADTIQAIADEPVRIVVRGHDPDVDGSGMRDPIWFRVDRAPSNGFFIAPLYPYFIDDYRMTARYSPWIAQKEGEAFAWQVAQDTSAMRDYIKQLCAEDINRTDLPKDFISFAGGNQKYMAVDDQGFTYIYDQAYRKCTPGGSTIAPTTSSRISVWDQDGLYLGEQVRSNSSGGRPLRNIKFNVGRRTIISTESDGSSTGNSLVNLSRIQPENANDPIVNVRSYGLWNSVNDIYIPSEDVKRQPEYKNAGAAALDNNTGVLYVIGDRNHNIKGLSAFMPDYCNNSTKPGPEDCLTYLGSHVFAYDITQSTKWGDFPGLDGDAMRLRQIADITLDSLGNVYVIAKKDINNRFDRIYKFSAATKNPDGSVTLGEYAGWMGRCDSGPNCNYIEKRSIGFSCTDDTCSVQGDSWGERPGQFHNAAALAMDPNDVLYVADTGNSRVQRFTPEGLFAGEARSKSSCEGCSGFVLGDFGSPGNIAVNSNNFYILNKAEELVHVFETSVIHSIDNKSAWVEYQSGTNYVGQDSFTFRATDGFRKANGDLAESAPAKVAINVKRNHRPPIGEDGWATTVEDASVQIKLKGYDLDGDRDTLTFKISFQPQYGSLSGSPPNVAYQPNADFAGADAFQFTVSDGRFMSDPATVTIEVTPVNDPPVVTPDTDPLLAGLGHETTLRAIILDPDSGDELTGIVDWGDGTQENTRDLTIPGALGPSLTPLLAGEAELLGHHTYRNPGSYTVSIEVKDKSGAKGTSQVRVNVSLLADIELKRTAQPLTPTNQRQVSYELTARNRRSPHGDGAAANSVQVTEVITGSANFSAAIASAGSCQVERKMITCDLGTLNPDQQEKVTVQLNVGGNAVAGSVIVLDALAKSGSVDPIPENNRDRFDLSVVSTGDIYVNSLRDGADSSPGDGVCATSQGECTVRAAIMEANVYAGPQVIILGAGIYVLENTSGAAASAADSESTGDLDISSDIVLRGIGAQRTALHANGVDRVLDIHSGTVRIVGMTLSGGDAGENADGGAIHNDGGDVTLVRMSFDGNRARNGGGLMHRSGTITLRQSSIIQNVALGSGGGIYNQASMSLENVTVSGNQAVDGGGFAGSGGDAQMLHVTLAGNSASNAGGGVNGAGATVRIENTLLAGNDAPAGPDCAQGVGSGGYNVVGKTDGCNLFGTNDGNVMGRSPMIDSLMLNMGQTYSHPLMAGSPALERAKCVLNVDQGGGKRPDSKCDVGAYEAGAFPATVQVLLPAVQRR